LRRTSPSTAAAHTERHVQRCAPAAILQVQSGAAFTEVRDEVKDMSAYLESDTLRRQANTVVRLTVVTVFGLIGTVLTGIFGMNLFDFPGIPLPVQIMLFVMMGVLVTTLLFYTLAKSKALADFLDAVSDTAVPTRAKFKAFVEVWRSGPSHRDPPARPTPR
jgi:uncharacterized protein YacL